MQPNVLVSVKCRSNLVLCLEGMLSNPVTSLLNYLLGKHLIFEFNSYSEAHILTISILYLPLIHISSLLLSCLCTSNFYHRSFSAGPVN